MDILTTDMDIGAERRGKLKLSLRQLLLLIPKLIPGMDTMVDIMDTPMDITIMARDLLKLKLSLKLRLLLKLILRLIPGMDTMVVTMDILTMDMDIGAERRGKLKLSLRQLLLLIPKLTPGMDTMVDIMDTPMDITIMARDL